MAPANIPTVESFTDSFPNKLPKHQGPPTFDSLKHAKDLLKGNAASVPSTRGGGSHGYLGLILSPAAYATIDPTPFDAPNFPGAQPDIPAGATVAVRDTIIRQHTEELREWREYINLHEAIKQQLLAAFDPIYFRALRNRHVGFANRTIREMLEFLFTNYGYITPMDLKTNTDRLNTPWDPSTPFEMLIDQVEECQELAEIGNQPYSHEQIVNAAYTLIYNTGMFFEDCKIWNKKPVAEKTWDNFKTFFFEAHRELRQQQTTQQSGFHAANAAALADEHDNMYNAIANLATATQSDRDTVTKLQTAITKLTQQLTAQAQTISKLQTNGTTGTRNSGINNRTGGNPNYVPTDRGSYCWSHGYLVHARHTSGNCRNKKDGHKDDATRENNMEGSQVGKPST